MRWGWLLVLLGLVPSPVSAFPSFAPGFPAYTPVPQSFDAFRTSTRATGVKFQYPLKASGVTYTFETVLDQSRWKGLYLKSVSDGEAFYTLFDYDWGRALPPLWTLVFSNSNFFWDRASIIPQDPDPDATGQATLTQIEFDPRRQRLSCLWNIDRVLATSNAGQVKVDFFVENGRLLTNISILQDQPVANRFGASFYLYAVEFPRLLLSATAFEPPGSQPRDVQNYRLSHDMGLFQAWAFTDVPWGAYLGGVGPPYLCYWRRDMNAFPFTDQGGLYLSPLPERRLMAARYARRYKTSLPSPADDFFELFCATGVPDSVLSSRESGGTRPVGAISCQIGAVQAWCAETNCYNQPWDTNTGAALASNITRPNPRSLLDYEIRLLPGSTPAHPQRRGGWYAAAQTFRQWLDEGAAKGREVPLPSYRVAANPAIPDRIRDATIGLYAWNQYYGDSTDYNASAVPYAPRPGYDHFTDLLDDYAREFGAVLPDYTQETADGNVAETKLLFCAGWPWAHDQPQWEKDRQGWIEENRGQGRGHRDQGSGTREKATSGKILTRTSHQISVTARNSPSPHDETGEKSGLDPKPSTLGPGIQQAILNWAWPAEEFLLSGSVRAGVPVPTPDPQRDFCHRPLPEPDTSYYAFESTAQITGPHHPDEDEEGPDRVFKPGYRAFCEKIARPHLSPSGELLTIKNIVAVNGVNHFGNVMFRKGLIHSTAAIKGLPIGLEWLPDAGSTRAQEVFGDLYGSLMEPRQGTDGGTFRYADLLFHAWSFYLLHDVDSLDTFPAGNPASGEGEHPWLKRGAAAYGSSVYDNDHRVPEGMRLDKGGHDNRFLGGYGNYGGYGLQRTINLALEKVPNEERNEVGFVQERFATAAIDLMPVIWGNTATNHYTASYGGTVGLGPDGNYANTSIPSFGVPHGPAVYNDTTVRFMNGTWWGAGAWMWDVSGAKESQATRPYKSPSGLDDEDLWFSKRLMHYFGPLGSNLFFASCLNAPEPLERDMTFDSYLWKLDPGRDPTQAEAARALEAAVDTYDFHLAAEFADGGRPFIIEIDKALDAVDRELPEGDLYHGREWVNEPTAQPIRQFVRELLAACRWTFSRSGTNAAGITLHEVMHEGRFLRPLWDHEEAVAAPVWPSATQIVGYGWAGVLPPSAWKEGPCGCPGPAEQYRRFHHTVPRVLTGTFRGLDGSLNFVFVNGQGKRSEIRDFPALPFESYLAEAPSLGEQPAWELWRMAPCAGVCTPTPLPSFDPQQAPAPPDGRKVASGTWGPDPLPPMLLLAGAGYGDSIACLRLVRKVAEQRPAIVLGGLGEVWLFRNAGGEVLNLLGNAGKAVHPHAFVEADAPSLVPADIGRAEVVYQPPDGLGVRVRLADQGNGYFEGGAPLTEAVPFDGNFLLPEIRPKYRGADGLPWPYFAITGRGASPPFEATGARPITEAIEKPVPTVHLLSSPLRTVLQQALERLPEVECKGLPVILSGGCVAEGLTTEDGGVLTLLAKPACPLQPGEILALLHKENGRWEPTEMWLADDGRGGDLKAGDGVYAAQIAVPPGVPEGVYYAVLGVADKFTKTILSDPFPFLSIHPVSAAPVPKVLLAGYGGMRLTRDGGGWLALAAFTSWEAVWNGGLQIFANGLPTGVFLTETEPGTWSYVQYLPPLPGDAGPGTRSDAPYLPPVPGDTGPGTWNDGRGLPPEEEPLRVPLELGTTMGGVPVILWPRLTVGP